MTELHYIALALVVWNVITFTLYGIDKRKARKNKWRISETTLIACAYCKCFIANYQKVGESNYVKMYNNRIIDGSIDFSQYHGAIFCPNGRERIATRYVTKMGKEEAYRFVLSASMNTVIISFHSCQLRLFS